MRDKIYKWADKRAAEDDEREKRRGTEHEEREERRHREREVREERRRTEHEEREERRRIEHLERTARLQALEAHRLKQEQVAEDLKARVKAAESAEYHRVTGAMALGATWEYCRLVLTTGSSDDVSLGIATVAKNVHAFHMMERGASAEDSFLIGITELGMAGWELCAVTHITDAPRLRQKLEATLAAQTTGESNGASGDTVASGKIEGTISSEWEGKDGHTTVRRSFYFKRRRPPEKTASVIEPAVALRAIDV